MLNVFYALDDSGDFQVLLDIFVSKVDCNPA